MIAGPNGAGKTTLTQHLLRKGIDLGDYINPDDIAAGLTGTLAQRTKQAQAIADERRNECIRAKRSFSFETVMSHSSKIDVLVRAKQEGYAVLLYFVGTDDPKTNVERVALRVAQGGHAVPDDKIRDRWLRTMTLLQQAIRSSDRSYIFDNSIAGTVDTVPRLIFYRSTIRPGRVPHSELFNNPPAWVKRFVLDAIGTNFLDKRAVFQRKATVGSIVTLPVQTRNQESAPHTIAALGETERRPIPHSIEAEQRLLGAIISKNEVFYEVPDFLKPKHLFEPIHQVLFEVVSNLIRANKPATPETILTSFSVDVDLGGLTLGQYLSRLEADVTASANAAEDGRTIYELSLRRELIRLGEDMVNTAHDNGAERPARAQIEYLTSQLQGLTEAGSHDRAEPSLPFPPPLTHGLHQFSRAVAGAVDSAARAFVRTGSGIKTGFVDLDRKIAGLQPSELIVLASRPGIGKTALATNIAYNAARSWTREGYDDQSVAAGGIVGFFSLEMSSEQIAARVISQQSRIPISTIRRGAISENEFEIIRGHAIEFQNLPFFIDETTTLSIDQLAARASRLKSEKGLDLLIIDNLELLRTVARANFGATREGSYQITRELKKIAKDLGIPVLVLAQLPSKIEKRHDPRPRLEEFSDRGAVEQDADVVIFLHRDDFYLGKEEPPFGGYEYEHWVKRMEVAHGLAELLIAKQRNGATGTIFLSFDPSIGSFGNLVP
jgi:replicative DNA helicase